MQDTAMSSQPDNFASTGSSVSTPASVALPTLENCMTTVAVGDGKTGVGSLTVMASQVASQCPQLAAILRSAAVRTQLEGYLGYDSEAKEQQKILKRDATIANLCLLGAGILSSLVLLVTALVPGNDVSQRYALWLGVVIIILGAIGSLFNHVAREQGRAGRWLARRGEAEVARLEAFREIAKQASEAGPSVATHGLALVVTHLLNDQRLWMSASASRHRKSSETTSLLGGVAVALAFVGGSGAVIASQVKDTVWIVLAGTIGAALAAYAINRDALLRDRANAERYEKARVALDALAGRIDDIAVRIRAGEPKALVAFMEAVAEQLSTEHKQWLEGTAQADAVLEKLDVQLKELSSGRRQASSDR